MDFLKFFSKTGKDPILTRLPRGSFTLDARGRILTSTLPQWFPPAKIQDIGKRVLTVFREAKQARMPLKEVIVHYETLKITARELRSGAMVFLSPKNESRHPIH